MIEIKQGLDIPLYGAPEQRIYSTLPSPEVALIGPDYQGMRPTMLVGEGDRVKRGQVVFSCKKRAGVNYTAPAGGKVVAIKRGERRRFETLVIAVDQQEQAVAFEPIVDFATATRTRVQTTLLDSGLWTSLRTRPYSKAPLPDSVPGDIFVQVIDTHPLAADQEVIISQDLRAFNHGLQALCELTDGKVYVCVRGGSLLTSPREQIVIAPFIGPHPAGNPGTHMHLLSAVSERKSNWWLDAQDVIAMGKLFLTGELNCTRVVALAGPQVKAPRLLRTRIGACLDHLTRYQLYSGESRVIAGSVLYGRERTQPFHYLARFARQVTVLREDREREFLGWHSPGFNKFSIKPIYLSAMNPSKKFRLTTTTHGSRRAIVPIGMYEKVMPLDILPTLLLRSLSAQDSEYARRLGALELDEEDLALCTFVDPGKNDFGPLLRQSLETIEREG